MEEELWGEGVYGSDWGGGEKAISCLEVDRGLASITWEELVKFKFF